MVANIPEKLMNSSGRLVKNLSQEDLKKLNLWAKNKEARQIFFAGKPGRGKTCCAIALMRFFEREIPLVDQWYCFMPELFEVWKAQMHDGYANFDLMQKLQNFKVLVFDDMGTKNPSPGFLDFLYCIINTRGLSNCRTVYTSNLSSQELNDSFGPRIVSRITSEIVLKFEGKDLRSIEF